MNQIEFLERQTKNAYEWTNKLIESIPPEKWDTTPEIIESNVSWQVGHLVLSTYFHSIRVSAGHQKDILEQIPMREYATLFTGLFTDTSPQKAVGKISPEELQDHLTIVQKKSLDIIRSLSPDDLDNKLEPTRVPHPVAKTKFEALDWNIKHTMWHCGQLAILKRIIHERFDFGLKKPEENDE